MKTNRCCHFCGQKLIFLKKREEFYCNKCRRFFAKSFKVQPYKEAVKKAIERLKRKKH